MLLFHTVIAIVVLGFGSIPILLILAKPRECEDVMHQAVGDAPRFTRHVRSVEDEEC